ncbi:MAG: hypothetical protein JWP11_1467 [Frankiales bacterium]|nr:hypothetical protein [Frankiales bacterium]
MAVVVPLATTGVLALGELAASAHTTAIQGTAICDTAAGTYSVHWVGATDLVPANDVAKVDITSFSPDPASKVPASPITTTLAPNASYEFDQTDIPGNAGTASVAVHVYWTPTAPGIADSDTFDAPASGSVVNLPPCSKTPAPVQTLAGHIYLCPSTGPTTTEIAAGSLTATGGTPASTVAGQPNPLAPTSVNAGDYTMTAGAPAGYTFVQCGSTAVINGPATSATEALNVPSGGSATGVFYVRQIPAPVQTLAGHIYLCPATGATTTEVGAGTLAATGGTPASTIASQTNPLAPTNVSAGDYTMAAGAPAGYTFVQCGSTAVINGAATGATEALTVPSGGSATGIFYVRQIPPPVVCPAGTTMGSNGSCVPPVVCPAGTTMAADGTCTPPVVVPPVTCPAGSTMTANGTCEAPAVIPPVGPCPAGTTMGANGTCAPPVVCPTGTTMGANGTCTPPVVAPTVGPCPKGTTMGTNGTCLPNVVSGGTTGGASGPVVAPVTPPKKPVTGQTTTPVEATPAATAPTALPFTGSNSGVLLELGLLLLLAGGILTVGNRRKPAFRIV